MTIERFYEVNCDGCMNDAFQEEANDQHAVWSRLKKMGWKRRGRLLWCPRCVQAGLFRIKHVEWRSDE